MYDVRAEGSIINIKRNNFGDPEMLILSSRKEIKDLMKAHKTKKRRLSAPGPKSKSQSRSRSRPKQAEKSKQESKKVVKN